MSQMAGHEPDGRHRDVQQHERLWTNAGEGTRACSKHHPGVTTATAPNTRP
jgi:hypothetical protein